MEIQMEMDVDLLRIRGCGKFQGWIDENLMFYF